MPIVFRAAGGAGRSYGATHSQMLEGWFMHMPGLKVVAPATAEDAKGLLISAIRDDDPVLMVEHKDLYKVRMPLAATPGAVPIGKARIVREGDAVTILTYSKIVHTAGLAAAQLAKEGIAVEVMDLRSLDHWTPRPSPPPYEKPDAPSCSPKRWALRGRRPKSPRWSWIMAFDYLNAPIIRLTPPEVAIPFSPTLEQQTIPRDKGCYPGREESVITHEGRAK